MNNHKKIYGVLGYPSKHSLSPLMHNAAFKALGINAEYQIFEVPPQKLEDFFESLRDNHISGLNVTIPYKERVIKYIDRISDEANLIGAVNTIRVLESGLEGFNTDGEGFLTHLLEVFDYDPRGKAIAILGAGGASKAVSVYLCKNAPKSMAIYDVDRDKTKSLVDHLKDSCSNVVSIAADLIEDLHIEKADLLVNATPIGMKDSDPTLVDPKFLHKGLFVYDLIYNPRETKLLKMAKKEGAVTSDGLGMLLYQGMLSFEIWTGKKAPKDVMEKALVAAIRP